MDNIQTSVQQPTLHSQRMQLVLVGFVMLLLGLVGGYLLSANNTSQQNQVAINAPSPVSENPTPTLNREPQWKTYWTENYTVDYPPRWYTYTYPDQTECTIISDISNPQDIPNKISPNGHTIVQVCDSNLGIPESFPYTNGSSKNTTIKPYSISGYSGIRGKQTSSIGEVDVVYLSNPKGGHSELQLQTGDLVVFEKILSSFKFTQ